MSEEQERRAEANALSVLASFAHEVLMCAFPLSETASKAHIALERAGLLNFEKVAALSAPAPHPVAPASVQDVMFEVFRYAQISDGFDSLEAGDREACRESMFKQDRKIRAMLTALATPTEDPAITVEAEPAKDAEMDTHMDEVMRMCQNIEHNYAFVGDVAFPRGRERLRNLIERQPYPKSPVSDEAILDAAKQEIGFERNELQMVNARDLVAICRAVLEPAHPKPAAQSEPANVANLILDMDALILSRAASILAGDRAAPASKEEALAKTDMRCPNCYEFPSEGPCRCQARATTPPPATQVGSEPDIVCDKCFVAGLLVCECATTQAPPVGAMADIQAERARQDAQWGGPGHDDEHYGEDWRGYIRKQLAEMNDTNYRQRERFIKIAALAVAAIESIDRKEGKALATTQAPPVGVSDEQIDATLERHNEVHGPVNTYTAVRRFARMVLALRGSEGKTT